MDNDNSPLGFADTPPYKGEDRHNPRKEQSASPPAERPVYTTESDFTSGRYMKKKGSGWPLAFTVIGVVALIAASALIYRFGPVILKKGAPAAVVDPVKETSKAMLRIETLRTIALLDSLAMEHPGDEEKLGEIAALRQKAGDILRELDGAVAAGRSE